MKDTANSAVEFDQPEFITWDCKDEDRVCEEFILASNEISQIRDLIQQNMHAVRMIDVLFETNYSSRILDTAVFW